MGKIINHLLRGLVLAFLALPAFAQSSDQIINNCENPNPDISIPACTTIIDGGPEIGAYLFEAYVNRSVAEAKKGMFTQAISDDTQAIALNPANARILLNRARAYEAIGSYAQAIADTSRSIELDPSNADAYRLRGIAEASSGLWDAAIADQTKAIAIAPRDPQAYWARAMAHGAQHQLGAALADLNSVIALSPANSKALAARGSLFMEMNHPDLALPDLNKALALDPENVDAGVTLGLYYGAKGLWTQEITQLSKMLQTGRLLAPRIFRYLYQSRDGL